MDRHRRVLPVKKLQQRIVTKELFAAHWKIGILIFSTGLHSGNFDTILIGTTPATLLRLFRQASAPGGFFVYWGT
jgi:hypothetical protein